MELPCSLTRYMLSFPDVALTETHCYKYMKNELHSSALDTGRTLLQPMFGALCYHHKVESEGLILHSKASSLLAPLLWDSRKPGVERKNPIAKVTSTLLSTSMSFRPDLKEFCDTKRAWCSCNTRLRSSAFQTWTISRGFWSRIIPQKFYSASLSANNIRSSLADHSLRDGWGSWRLSAIDF